MMPHVTMPIQQIAIPAPNPSLSKAAWSDLFIPMMNAISNELQTTVLTI